GFNACGVLGLCLAIAGAGKGSSDCEGGKGDAEDSAGSEITGETLGVPRSPQDKVVFVDGSRGSVRRLVLRQLVV
ncbi:hypothetical protein F4774DRAFT_426068, partial [Daldinia eschscholtzii]